MSNYKNFSRKLNAWFRKNARDLPFRETSDPYKIWISEIMLQQTTVAAVIPYYKKWIVTYPTVESVARASLQKILKSWQGLGYYSRARNIHKAAKIIVKEHNGKLPKTYDQLKSLPGLGPYTCGAVLSIAYNKRYPIIDANVRRVTMRILGIKGKSTPKVDGQISKFLDIVLPYKNLNIFNQAYMELGALVCRKENPTCNICPIKEYCIACKKGIQELIPETQSKNIKTLEVSIAVIKEKEKYLIQKRSSKGLLADLWEFPGGKIEKGEAPLQALKREVSEELDCEVDGHKFFMNVVHYYTHFKVNLHVWICTLKGKPKLHDSRKILNLKDLKKYPMPSGSVKIVDRLMADFSPK